MSEAVVAVDREGVIIFWNRGAEELFGRGEEMIGAKFPQAFQPDEIPRIIELFDLLRTSSVAAADVPFRHARHRGPPR